MNERYEILPIDTATWRIEDGMVRTYLLAGTDSALLVDTGMTLTDARAIAEGLTDKPVKLLNTHGDPDHIAGNGAFPGFFMHPAEEENYRAHGGAGEIIPVRGGDVLDLGGREIEIVELPGHTPGSIALLDRSRRVLISGDAIQAGSFGSISPRSAAFRSASGSLTRSGPPTAHSPSRLSRSAGSASALSGSSRDRWRGRPTKCAEYLCASMTWAVRSS